MKRSAIVRRLVVSALVTSTAIVGLAYSSAHNSSPIVGKPSTIAAAKFVAIGQTLPPSTDAGKAIPSNIEDTSYGGPEGPARPGQDDPMPADYNGDLSMDLAVVHNDGTNLLWEVQPMGNVYFGSNGDIPIACYCKQYIGDSTSRADTAIYRPSNHEFYIRNWNTGTIYGLVYGTTGDYPMIGDYLGGQTSPIDANQEVAVFRPSQQLLYVYNVGNFFYNGQIQNVSGGFQLTAYYDSRSACYGVGGCTTRTQEGGFYQAPVIKPLCYTGSACSPQGNFGTTGDISFTYDFGEMSLNLPACGGLYTANYRSTDFNSISVMRPGVQSYFYIQDVGSLSGNTYSSLAFGTNGDINVSGHWYGSYNYTDYCAPHGSWQPWTDIAVFRHSNATWYFQNGTSVVFGSPW